MNPKVESQEIKRIMDTNVLGLSICTREAIQLMKEKGVDDGQIVHIGSICGHMQCGLFPSALYYASKHAVRVLLEGLRKELVAAKSRIRVMEISPGSVFTEILDDMKIVTAEMRFKDPYLWAEDIADIVLYVTSAPPHVQIHEVIVVPTGETM
ncbi:Farnesol dehydrogenase [Gryllus bimaculatus]|nr:Farnesol dehydrogenase [Gryllus bimaculatus]